ncbi:MAG TPA: UDP-N-acetylglucosamine 1-carboxyvinyltransferase [Acidimicrobiales bacterium]|nr:UDP-N-acetylglucosamine 1-carboxyvinyltransferase [Acidimicrobiales bacterium]
MSAFLVRPAGPLSGSVRVQGAKNSALKLMAASLLTSGTTELRNVPRIADVGAMSDVLAATGATTERRGEWLRITTPGDAVPIAPYELVERLRASVVVLGPLLARHGSAHVSLPGGDDFGPRPIDIHLRALSELGAELTVEHGYIEGRCDRLVGQRIVFEYPSHTATDNVLMAATLAKGTTVIENAAREPEVQDLAAFLTAMGARIDGAGTARIEIEGVEELHPAAHTTVADRIEAVTYLAAVGLAGGEVAVQGACAAHIEMTLEKLARMGLEIEELVGGVGARFEGRLSSVDFSTLPYPGVATDYKPMLMVMLSVASGVAIVSENIYAGRFRYVDELCRMGADIRTEGHHAVVRGVPRLSGAPVRAPDIRAGAALVLAGLAAEGETLVTGTEHVDRGYEDLAGKLASLGADVTRLTEEWSGGAGEMAADAALP